MSPVPLHCEKHATLGGHQNDGVATLKSISLAHSVDAARRRRCPN